MKDQDFKRYTANINGEIQATNFYTANINGR